MFKDLPVDKRAFSKMVYIIVKSNSHPPKNFFISFNNSPLKMMKNAFYFILKAQFVLKIFAFLS